MADVQEVSFNQGGSFKITKQGENAFNLVVNDGTTQASANITQAEVEAIASLAKVAAE